MLRLLVFVFTIYKHLMNFALQKIVNFLYLFVETNIIKHDPIEK